MGGRELGGLEAHESATLARLAFDLDRGANPVVDQEAIREADVRLESGQTCRLELVAQRRHGPRYVGHDPHHRRAVEAGEPHRLDHDSRLSLQPLCRLRRGEEIGPEPVVLDQEWTPLVEAPVEQHDGHAIANAVGGLDDETGGHGDASESFRLVDGGRRC